MNTTSLPELLRAIETGEHPIDTQWLGDSLAGLQAAKSSGAGHAAVLAAKAAAILPNKAEWKAWTTRHGIKTSHANNLRRVGDMLLEMPQDVRPALMRADHRKLLAIGRVPENRRARLLESLDIATASRADVAKAAAGLLPAAAKPKQTPLMKSAVNPLAALKEAIEAAAVLRGGAISNKELAAAGVAISDDDAARGLAGAVGMVVACCERVEAAGANYQFSESVRKTAVIMRRVADILDAAVSAEQTNPETQNAAPRRRAA